MALRYIAGLFYCLISILSLILHCSAQTCSNSDIVTLTTCSDPVLKILTSIENQWPIPLPIPGLNNSVINQLCSAYNSYLNCLTPRNSTCGTNKNVTDIVSVAGYLCVEQFSLFSTQSDCIKNFLSNPNSALSKCIQTAAEVDFHNLMDTQVEMCNAFKDAASCVYPLVQSKCGANVGNALTEFSRRVALTMSGDCEIVQCYNNTYCTYDQTCRSGRNCQCAIVCPQQSTPQCASDSQIYGNECLLRKQSCLTSTWLLDRPMSYCNIHSTNPTQCTDSVVDRYAHCILPLYNGMIASFRTLDDYLANFNGYMINKTCAIYNSYTQCSVTVPPTCALPNGAILDELYKKYVCTDTGFNDLVNNKNCWQTVGNDNTFQQCSQDFGDTVDNLQYYNVGSYVDSFIYDFGGMCTALHNLGTCVMPRVQALCNSNAVTVFNKIFQTYKMFMVNCNSVCKSVIDSVYGIISSNNWPAANLDTEKCTWHLQVPSGMNVNLLLRINQPFDCSPDNPTFISIYSGTAEDSSQRIGTYCGTFHQDNVYSTPNNVNQMTIVYEKTMSNSVSSPPFVAMFYAGTDACLSSPCISGSTCVNTAGGYYCQCPAGYVGSLCDIYAGKCNAAVCKNGGTCVDTFMVTDITNFNNVDPSQEFGYYCKCAAGFSGPTCKSAGSPITQEADTQCPTNWVPQGQKCFFISPTPVDEPSSEDACKAAGATGLLTSMHSETERNFIQQLMITNAVSAIWIGLRHDGESWRWLDETPFDYQAWAGTPGSERCVLLAANVTYRWITSDCYPNTAAYVCDMSPPVNCNIVNPCQNGGTCVTTNGVGSCTCPTSFTGTYCDSLASCSPSPCLNGGTCQQSSNNFFTCVCAAGFNGTICDTSTSACNSNPCQNGGRCTTTSGGYRCSCVLGYSGTNCQNLDNNCNSNPCQNGGTCSNGVNSYQCACVAGFTGLTCNININECSSFPCQNGGTCTDGVNSYTCTCLSGFTGTNCQTASSACASNPCFNGGTCTTTTSGFQCLCVTGFTGTLCQTTINYCSSNPCQNGGTCQSLNNLYTCTCPSGFSGSNCQISTSGNTCATSPCLNGATCINGATSYFCQCPVGYFGLQCGQSSAVCNSNPCSNGGSCIDLNGAFTCKCRTGYSGTQCQYSNTNVCLNNSPCLDGGICSYSDGVTVCSCSSSFQGPTCQQVGSNQCANFPCQNGGTCISGINYYYCLCPSFYIGLNCQTLSSSSNACTSNPCQNGATCVTLSSGFSCNCASGFSGTFCSIGGSGMCANNLCQNGATCVATPSTYTCQCRSGYSGYYCETNVNSCLSNPCQNGGTCTNGANSFRCQCTSGFGGPTCSQVAGSMCTPNPCQNSGQCVTLSNTDYLCRCLAGWIGANCEVDQNECLQTPCKNSGICANTAGSYYCTCQTGYQGSDCSQISNACSSNPCANGGTCTSLSSTAGYQCTCVPEYTGPQCNYAMCQSGWKFNGGYCYTVLTSTVSETMAKQSCTNNNNNAQLVSIHDVNERDFVASLMTSNNLDRAWIGAQYSTSTSSWSWADQSSWNYVSWGTGQPATPASLPCAYQILQNGVTWQTSNCNGPHAIVCKTNGKITGTSSSYPCASNPCQNSGTCSAVGTSYVCTCSAGFGGTNCESSATACQSNPCFNGGTCKVVGTSYICTCTNGYTVSSSCRLPCPSGWKWFMSKCYLPMNSAVSYDAAANSCPSQQSSSRLFFVETQDEFYYASTLANQMSSNIWLGLVFQSSTGTFQWTNGQYLGTNDYQAWGFNQPATPSTTKCVQIVGYQGFTWETYDCTKTLKYICKWDGSS